MIMQEKSLKFLEFYLRLNETIKKHGLSISSVEEKLQLGRGTLNNAIKRGSSLGIDKVFKILEFFPYEDLNWLFKGETPEDIEKILRDEDNALRKASTEKIPMDLQRKVNFLMEQVQDMSKTLYEVGQKTEKHEEQLKHLTGR